MAKFPGPSPLDAGEPLPSRIHRRPFGHGPGLEDPVDLQPEIVMGMTIILCPVWKHGEPYSAGSREGPSMPSCQGWGSMPRPRRPGPPQNPKILWGGLLLIIFEAYRCGPRLPPTLVSLIHQNRSSPPGPIQRRSLAGDSRVWVGDTGSGHRCSGSCRQGPRLIYRMWSSNFGAEGSS